MSSKKKDNKEPAVRQRAFQTYLEDLDDDLRRLLAVNAPTQTQTEKKARNVQVFARVLQKQYPKLKVEAVDISAHLYATDLRQLPLEVTFDLIGTLTDLETESGSEYHPLYDPHTLLKALSDGNMPVRIQSPPSWVFPPTYYRAFACPPPAILSNKPGFDFQILPPSPVHQLRTRLLQQYAENYQNMRDLVSILLLLNHYSYYDLEMSPTLVAFCVAAFYDSISARTKSEASSTPRAIPSMTVPFLSHPCTAVQLAPTGGQIVEDTIIPNRVRVWFAQLTLEATSEPQNTSLAKDLLDYLDWWSGRTWDHETISPATRVGIEQRHWRGEEEYTKTTPPPDAEYVPLVVRDPINRLENLASRVEKSSWSRARMHMRTLYRRLKQGIPLSQALPATSVHLRLLRVYSTLQGQVFNPQLVDKEILDDFQSQRPTELVLKKRQETMDRVKQLIQDSIASEGFEVVLFGSARYGVDTFKSDLDLVVLDQNLPEGFTPGAGQNLSKIYSLDPLARAMKRSGFKQVVAIKTAKVPIIKAVDSHTDLAIDININDRLGLYNSTLLEHYCKLWPPLSPLIFTIKRWAKAADLNNPAGRPGPPTFSSYSLTLMTIAWLQYREVLPNLQDLASALPESGSPAVKDQPSRFCIRLNMKGTRVLWCDTRFKRIDQAHWRPSTKLSVGEAFYEWLTFFAHDFDYQSLSLRISDGGVLPRRTKNPFIQKAKKKTKKRKTQAKNEGENEAAAPGTTKTEPTPDSKLEAQEHKKELMSNPEAEVFVQECVERPKHPVEPSEPVDVPEEDVIEVVEVGQEEHVQETLETAQALQDEGLEGELKHHRDVCVNRDPPNWVQAPLLVVDPFIGTKNCALVNKMVVTTFRSECQRALAILDAGRGVNEVLSETQAAATERNQGKKTGSRRTQKNSGKDAPPAPQPKVEKLQPPSQTPTSSTAKPPENVASSPPPAPAPDPTPGIQPPQPAKRPGASGGNKRRKTRAGKGQIPAASNIPPIPESQPGPST